MSNRTNYKMWIAFSASFWPWSRLFAFGKRESFEDERTTGRDHREWAVFSTCSSRTRNGALRRNHELYDIELEMGFVWLIYFFLFFFF